jgi:uncharacterized protein with HEPN domain
MSFESRDYLRHILVEVDYLVGHSAGLTYEAFAADETLRRAFVRSLESSAKRPRRFQRTLGFGMLRWSGGRWPACETV